MNIQRTYRFRDAVNKTIICSALFHVVIMVFYVLVSGAYETLNIFRVFGLTLFLPGIDEGILSFFISWTIPLGIFLLFYFYFTKKR